MSVQFAGNKKNHYFMFSLHVSWVVQSNWFPNRIPVNQSLWEGVEGWNILFQWLKEKDVVDIWMIICWQLWNNRNQCLHRLSCRRPSEIVRSIGNIRGEWEIRSEIFTEQRVIPEWQAPPEGIVKLNVDAASSFFHNQKRRI